MKYKKLIIILLLLFILCGIIVAYVVKNSETTNTDNLYSFIEENSKNSSNKKSFPMLKLIEMGAYPWTGTNRLKLC